jgi:single-stranded DNA-specific DHH superfamily exonuclease
LEHLDLAALGTIASGLPLEGENELLVKHGMGMMARSFSLAGCSRAVRMDAPVDPRLVAEMLLSLDDRVKQRAALHVLSSAVTSR